MTGILLAVMSPENVFPHIAGQFIFMKRTANLLANMYVTWLLD
jgi:hypothetical protein